MVKTWMGQRGKAGNLLARLYKYGFISMSQAEDELDMDKNYVYHVIADLQKINGMSISRETRLKDVIFYWNDYKIG